MWLDSQMRSFALLDSNKNDAKLVRFPSPVFYRPTQLVGRKIEAFEACQQPEFRWNGPVNLFALRYSNVRKESCPGSVGKVPVRRLSNNIKSCRLTRYFKSGIRPSKLLDPNRSWSTSVRFPSSAGIVPLNLLKERSSILSVVRNPCLVGMVLVNLFVSRYSI
jgi:hypothetical protein